MTLQRVEFVPAPDLRRPGENRPRGNSYEFQREPYGSECHRVKCHDATDDDVRDWWKKLLCQVLKESYTKNHQCRAKRDYVLRPLKEVGYAL